MDANDVGADLKQVLIPAERLQARVVELAAQIDRDYAGRELLLVGVLKGAVMIMADLARAMHLPVEMDWMAVSSYGSGTRSSGVVRILKDLDTDITGKDVLVVEDIVDSGLTLSWLVGNLRSRGPASVQGVRHAAQTGRGADGRGRGLHRFRHRERVRRSATASTTPSGTAICRSSGRWPRMCTRTASRRMLVKTRRRGGGRGAARRGEQDQRSGALTSAKAR